MVSRLKFRTEPRNQFAQIWNSVRVFLRRAPYRFAVNRASLWFRGASLWYWGVSALVRDLFSTAEQILCQLRKDALINPKCQRFAYVLLCDYLWTRQIRHCAT